MGKRMPALFVGHGSPMLALQHDDITRTLADLGKRIRTDFGAPRGILALSAHWFTNRTNVQTDSAPRQIYDMYGFPDELYEVRYPVAGCPALGQAVLAALGSAAHENNEWGIDHGTWTPLVHMFPAADVPVTQVSISRALDARESYAVGQALTGLRDEGYLIVGSGNVVHNLRAVDWGNPDGTKAAHAFDDAIQRLVRARDDEGFFAWERLPQARYAVPTPDHFLPLAYVLGAAEDETAQVFNNVCTLGALSMTGYAFGL